MNLPDDPINPKHYKVLPRMVEEVADVTQMFKLNHNLATTVQYILRAGKKHPDKFEEDLRKGIWYLERAIKEHNEVVNHEEA